MNLFSLTLSVPSLSLCLLWVEDLTRPWSEWAIKRRDVIWSNKRKACRCCVVIFHTIFSLSFFFKYSKNSQKIYIFVFSNFSSTLAKALDCFHFYKMRVRVYSKPQVVKLKMTLVPQSHQIHCGSICTLVIFSPLMLFIMLASLSIDL